MLVNDFLMRKFRHVGNSNTFIIQQYAKDSISKTLITKIIIL